MPIYLVHAFRWRRPTIRIHVIMNKLDDCAPDWLIAPATSKQLMTNLRNLHPRIMLYLPPLRFIEQYDPHDLNIKTQPFAYVADIVHEIKLGADIDQLREQRIPFQQWDAFHQLRDQIQHEEKVAWYVVYCGDEERSYSEPGTPTTETFSHVSNGVWAEADVNDKPSLASSSEGNGQVSNGHVSTEDFRSQRARRGSFSRNFRKMFGRSDSVKSTKSLKKAKSLKDLKQPNGMQSYVSGPSHSPPPPLPRPPSTSHGPTKRTPGMAM